MTRRLLGGLVITGLALVLVARADDPAKDNDKVDPKASSEAATNRQDRLKYQFREFESALLRLKQRLAESPRAEDKQKAVTLDKAMKEASDHAIDTRFEKLVQLVADSKTFQDLNEIQKAIDYNRQLMDD